MEPSYELGQFTRDESKAQSRANLKEFIKGAYGSRGGRLKVAFLAGPSIIDYTEIFEPLGVRPENAYGIEMNDEAFALAQQENSKRKRPINLFKGTDTEFYAQSPQLDVVYLDFLQNYGPAVVSSIDDIMVQHPHLLGSDSVLAINMQARREAKKNQNRLEALQMLGAKAFHDGYRYFRDIYARLLRMGDNDNQLIPDNIFNLFGEFTMLRKRGLMPSVDECYTHAHRRGLYFEVALRGMFPLLFGDRKEEIRAALRENGLIPDSLEQYYLEQEGTGMDSLEATAIISFDSAKELFNYLALEKLQKATGKSKFSQEEVFLHMAEEFLENRARGLDISEYFVDQYNSESGAPMLMQAFRLKRTPWHNFRPVSSKSFKTILNSKTAQNYIQRCAQRGRIKGFRQNAVKEIVRINEILLNDFKYLMRSEGIFLDRFNEFLQRIKNVMEKLEEKQSADSKLPKREEAKLEKILEAASNQKHQSNIQEESPAEYKTDANSEIQKDASANEPVEEKRRHTLTGSDKESIRGLYSDGCSPSEIHEALFAGTDITIAQIRAICAWKTIREKQETSA